MSNETLDIFEARIYENLRCLGEEQDPKERARLINEVNVLSTKLSEAEKTVYGYAESEAQRELDDLKSKRTLEAELKKADTDWKRTAVEVAKVVVPAAVSIISLKLWDEKFEQTLKFEETGRFVSTGFRILKFPKMF